MTWSAWTHSWHSRRLLHGRRIQRPHALGRCARCGTVLEGQTESWSGFEALLAEHATSCGARGRAVPTVEAPAPVVALHAAWADLSYRSGASLRARR